jgi:ATP-dependent Lon protease
VDLLGNALPIGGLKEKLLAALRGGIAKVLIPKENVKDLADIPNNVKKGLEIVPVISITEVLKHALLKMPEPTEEKPAADVTTRPAETKQKGVIHH